MRAEVPLGHPAFGKAQPCSCQAQATEGERLARLLQYSNVGPLARVTFEMLKPEGRSSEPDLQRRFREAYQAAQEYADAPQGWLLFTGPVGAGKTSLLAAMTVRCAQRGVPAFYDSVPDLLDHLRRAFAPTSEVTFDRRFDEVRGAPVLLLDDLGAHATTPWAREKLNQILNHRFNLQLPTVIALSGTLSQLEEPLRARLEDKGLVMTVELGRSPSTHWQQDSMIEDMAPRMTFETFDVRGNDADAAGQESLRRALNSARVFAQEPSGWLVLTGVTGCGKTHLAVAIINERRRRGEEPMYRFVPRLLDYLRAAFSPQSSFSYDQLFEEICTAPLLVLDDLGAHSSTPWAEEKLYQILVQRHEARRPTVITVRGLLEDLPDAVASRLKDVSLVELVPIGAPDFRGGGRRARGTRARR